MTVEDEGHPRRPWPVREANISNQYYVMNFMRKNVLQGWLLQLCVAMFFQMRRLKYEAAISAVHDQISSIQCMALWYFFLLRVFFCQSCYDYGNRFG